MLPNNIFFLSWVLIGCQLPANQLEAYLLKFTYEWKFPLKTHIS